MTGDKIETAINIGYSAGLLSNDIYRFIVDAKGTFEILQQIQKVEANIFMFWKEPHAMIVSGESFYKICARDDLKDKFIEVADKMQVIIACRTSPK